MYASPVAYTISSVPANLRFWYDLNPLVPLIVAFRWSIFGIGMADLPHLAYAVGATLLVLTAGLFSFKRMERRFADVI
jgi:lipopolysaccharide transport system permease protein